ADRSDGSDRHANHRSAGRPRTHPGDFARASRRSGPQPHRGLQDIVGRVEFDHVTFSYDGAREVLRDVSFGSEPGTVTALVGSSGSGKSTTIGLISAFHVPTAGKILVD